MVPEDPIIFSDSGSSLRLSRAVRAGRARRLARGVFTTDLSAAPDRLLRDHFTKVTAHFCPGAIIADRSAPLARPDERGFLFVIHPRARPVVLPGLTIVPRQGPPPLPDDLPMPDGLWLSSRARALLENLRPSRSVKGRPARTLRQRELHDWVTRLLRTEGPDRLNHLRDRAREIAATLDLEDELRRLDDVVGSALGTRDVVTTSPTLLAAQAGLAYDEVCDDKFRILSEWLRDRAPSPRPVLPEDRPRQKLLPFFEAYFSNFIEGTEFELDEAREIVFEGVLPPNRPEDAHDILGTYRIVADDLEMRRRPTTLETLLQLLKERHARVMAGRPDRQPGAFKTRPNRAGSTLFVAPHLVTGTLARGLSHLEAIEDPFARAVMMMFVISEVHPFADGNGRVARIMMNAELHAAFEHRILIPTVFWGEYLSSLRAMTHNRQPTALVRVLDFAQRYTLEIDFGTYEQAKTLLAETHAFVDPTEAQSRGIRLTLPSARGR